MKLTNNALLILLLSFVQMVHAQYNIELLDTAVYESNLNVPIKSVSFRGITSPSEQIFWATGSKGVVARSEDGSKSVSIMQIKGYEKSDFRDVHAWDAKRAVIMSSGTPAVILKTNDGGKTWYETFKQSDTSWFLDAIDFWDELRGIAIADPINSRFVLLQTHDGGQSWQQMDPTQTPEALEGENLFAASGTALRCWGKNEFAFVTGGAQSRFILFDGKNFKTIQLNIMQGENSKGANSLIRCDKNKFFIVGGDYKDTLATQQNACTVMMHDAKLTLLQNQANHLKYYTSCVDVLKQEKSGIIFIATGINGTFVFDNNWNKIHRIPFHTMAKAPLAKVIYLAGAAGRIGKLKLN